MMSPGYGEIDEVSFHLISVPGLGEAYAVTVDNKNC